MSVCQIRRPPDNDTIVQRLDEILRVENKTSEQYMLELCRYVTNMTQPWKPRTDFRVDTSAGITWVVIIPILYFLTVAIILGILLSYTWYTEDSKRRKEMSSVSAGTEMRSSLNVFRNDPNEPASAPDAFARCYNNTAVARSGAVKNVARASVGSRATVASLGVLANEDLIAAPRLRYSAMGTGTNHEVCRSSNQQTGSIGVEIENVDAKLSKRFTAGCRAMENRLNFTHVSLASSATGRSMTSDVLDDNLSRDSLRASMESHKLVWLGDGKIQPDDMYAFSEKNPTELEHSFPVYPGINDLDGPDFSGRESNVDGASFLTDNSQVERARENLRAKFEEIRILARNIRIPDDSPSRGDDLDKNISGLSTATNYPASTQDLVGYTIYSSSSSSSGAEDRAHNTSPVSTGRDYPLTVNTGTNVYALPPLPPRQFPRNYVSAPAGRFRERSVSQEPELNDQFDKTSFQDSSVESGTLSLPSSISRFHASKVGSHPSPWSSYPLASTRNYTPATGDSVQSSDSQMDNLSNQFTDLDNASLCPQVGSYSRSSTASAPGVLGSEKPEIEVEQGSHWEDKGNTREPCSVPREDKGNRREPCSVPREDKGNRREPCSVPREDKVWNETSVSEGKEIKEVGAIEKWNVVSEGKSAASQEEESGETLSPLIRNGSDSVFARRHSLEVLRPGRVSVEQRLREFGFIKPWGKRKYVINPSPTRFTERPYRFPDNRDGAESTFQESRSEGLTQMDMADFGKNGINLMGTDSVVVTEVFSWGTQDDRPNIHRILDTSSVSSSTYQLRSNLDDVRFWEERMKNNHLQNFRQQQQQQGDSCFVVEIHNDSQIGNGDVKIDSFQEKRNSVHSMTSLKEMFEHGMSADIVKVRNSSVNAATTAGATAAAAPKRHCNIECVTKAKDKIRNTFKRQASRVQAVKPVKASDKLRREKTSLLSLTKPMPLNTMEPGSYWRNSTLDPCSVEHETNTTSSFRDSLSSDENPSTPSYNDATKPLFPQKGKDSKSSHWTSNSFSNATFENENEMNNEKKNSKTSQWASTSNSFTNATFEDDGGHTRENSCSTNVRRHSSPTPAGQGDSVQVHEVTQSCSFSTDGNTSPGGRQFGENRVSSMDLFSGHMVKQGVLSHDSDYFSRPHPSLMTPTTANSNQSSLIS